MAYTPHRRRKHDPEFTRRALEILADADEGCSEAVLLRAASRSTNLSVW
jgi:hypothetical protein